MRFLLLISFLAALLSAGCRTPESPVRRPGPLPASLTNATYLTEIIRHVYRWHFSDDQFVAPARDGSITLWLRMLDVERDADDRSQFAQLWIPSAGLALELKRADYSIPELQLEIRETEFRVQRTEESEESPAPEAQFTVIRLPAGETMDFLMRTRSDRQVPEGELRQRIRTSIIRYVGQHITNEVSEPQVAYLAPVSPVANDVWVFWENGRRIFHVSADFGIQEPSFWDHAPLTLDVIDLESSVVVSPEQVPGSNAFVSRDWMGRVLFNCMILGERVELPAETVNQLLRAAAVR
jgi:hypothetical protein